MGKKRKNKSKIKSKNNILNKQKKQNKQKKESKSVREFDYDNRNSSYSGIYSISAFLISLFVFVAMSLGLKDEWEDSVTIFVFFITYPICWFLIRKFKKECDRTKNKRSEIIDILIDISTDIGYLNPILLLFNAMSDFFERKIFSIAFSVAIVVLTIHIVVCVIKKHKRRINSDIDFDETFEEIQKCSTRNKHSRYKFTVILFLVVITILLFEICVHFNIINFDYNLIPYESISKVISDFFYNDYIVNILCTIITAIVLYFLQIKYSKYKLRRDFRCNEVIHDLYDGIECAYRIKLKEKQLKKEIGTLNDNNCEKDRSLKYYHFFVSNKQDFHLSHLSLTYYNNEILIDSVQTVFFLNLNFKLLNIINNIKNRKPNLEEEYPQIEGLLEKYEEEGKEADLLDLGRAIERYIVDVGFMGEYCLDLLNYLGYDPIPNKIYISIFNSMYPSAEKLIEYHHMPEKERYRISKKIYRKSIVKFIAYKVKKFFE